MTRQIHTTAPSSWGDSRPSAPPRPVTLRFERGTLALEGLEEIGPGLAALDVTWDPRSGFHRAPPWRYGALQEALSTETIVLCDRVPATWRVRRGDWRDVALRPYQQAALTAWERSDRTGLVVLPTGSGKTRLALGAMAELACATLVLVPTRVLLHQWRREIGTHYEGTVGMWGDGVRDPAPIMVTTFESAYRQMPRLGWRHELLVVDEAHHFGGGQRDEALEMSTARWRLGLTATPPSREEALAELRRLVGPTVFRTGVADLTGTYLADFDSHVLHIALEPDERAAYEEARRVFREWYGAFRRVAPFAEWKDAVAAANETPHGRAAMAAWRRSRRLVAYTKGKAAALAALLSNHHGQRVLVFTSDNATAYAIARRHLLVPMTCDIGRNERDAMLARFGEGELRGLVSSRVLNEGLDVPEAEVGIVVGGTRGGTGEHVQRIGRLLRPAPGKRATVYELVADRTVEVRQAEARRDGLTWGSR